MSEKKNALVLGAGGFIGNHMVTRLKSLGYWVRGVDLKAPDFGKTKADDFLYYDLRDRDRMAKAIRFAGIKDSYEVLAQQFDKPFDEIYQFAADMGGAGYIFTGEHDADIMHNSAQININLLDCINQHSKVWRLGYNPKATKIFYSSSACIYPAYNQEDPENPICTEESAYPAAPDSEYGWEKLFSERLYKSYQRNYGFNVRIARFHNIYGPGGTYEGGKEKAPAAICRKIIRADNNEIEIWGDGNQTRSFLYIDDCIDGVLALMNSDYTDPVNIGSEEMVTINKLVELANIENKPLKIKHIDGPTGVRGRNSDNTRMYRYTGWEPKVTLKEGIELTYTWIINQHGKLLRKDL